MHQNTYLEGTPSPVAVGEMQQQNNLIYWCQLQSIVHASIHNGFRWGESRAMVLVRETADL